MTARVTKPNGKTAVPGQGTTVMSDGDLMNLIYGMRNTNDGLWERAADQHGPHCGSEAALVAADAYDWVKLHGNVARRGRGGTPTAHSYTVRGIIRAGVRIK